MTKQQREQLNRAAPQLLRACKKFMWSYERHYMNFCNYSHLPKFKEAYCMAVRAIVKATEAP